MFSRDQLKRAASLTEEDFAQLGLPEDLFRDVPAKLVTQYRQRAGTEWPRELRRHPLAVRYTLLAALCWQREREITDDLVEPLIHIAHHMGVRAEEKVDAELMKYVKKVWVRLSYCTSLPRLLRRSWRAWSERLSTRLSARKRSRTSFVRQKPTKNTSSK